MIPMTLTAKRPIPALRGRLPAALVAMLPTLALTGVIWSLSSWGYYALVSAMGLESGYDEAPVLFAAYYVALAAAVLLVFRPVFWGLLSRAVFLSHAVAMAPILMLYGAFVALPLLPDVSVYRAPSNPPEFMFASA
ncbi:hypothetical protein [Pararhodobacter oceanensis]|uniref:hypothetical protein n=1 Tax=Pararhodobacter oceanensis TaxID=2172121 RepID=UPI003A9519C5